MKTNMMTIVLKWSLIFSSFCFHSVQAQVLEKVFTHEFEISENAVIHLNGPRNFNMEGHGTMSFGTEENNYVVKGKDWKPVLKIDQDFQINTWEDKKIKQVVEVKLLMADQAKGKELLEKLNVIPKEHATGNLEVDCSLNIKHFKIVNGFLRKDRSTIELNDGSIYPILKLEIKASVTVPKTNTLKVNLKYMNTTIQEHEGKIQGEITGGTLEAKKLQFLNAKFNLVTIYIDEITEFRVMSTQSKFNLGKVRKMMTMSSLSKYNIQKVDTLLISHSETEKYTIRTVKRIVSSGSTFTDFHIDKVQDFLDIRAGSGDIFIDHISSGFRRVALSNHFSTIRLGLQNNENYIITNYKNLFTSYKYPDGLVPIKYKQQQLTKSLLMGNKDKAGQIEIQCESCKVFFD